MIEEKPDKQFEPSNLPDEEKQKRGEHSDPDGAPYSLPQVEFDPAELDQGQQELDELNEDLPTASISGEGAAETELTFDFSENEAAAQKSESVLPATLTEIADTLFERIEPVIAPVEEIIKENVIEPILAGVSALSEQLSEAISAASESTEKNEPQPVSSAEMLDHKINFADSAETSVFVTSQPYEVTEAAPPTNLGNAGTSDSALIEPPDETQELDALGIEKLPALPATNRARLHVQSPNRIFLYWSVAGNPFATLQKAFGNRAANYSFCLRLVNLANNEEKLFEAGKEGSWWFDVAASANYRVDVGFVSANRPFIKLLSSNPVETPRAQPSSRVDAEADWRVSRVQFARVLDVSGYAHDALPVVFGFGEDNVFDETATVAVLNQLASNAPATAEVFDQAEMRVALAALAAGVRFAALRPQLSPVLQAWFDSVFEQNRDALNSESVLAAMQAVFGAEFIEGFAGLNEDLQRIRLEPVWGASAVHFPEIVLPRIFGRLPENLFPTSPVFVNRES